MDPIIAETIGPVIALISVGTFVLVGLKMRYDFRAKHLQSGGGSEVTQRLEAQMEALREQVLALRDDVGELYERVEFAERLLARGKDDRALKAGEDA